MNPEALQSGIGFPLFPPQASLMAGRVDRLFFTMIAITGLVTVLVAAVIV